MAQHIPDFSDTTCDGCELPAALEAAQRRIEALEGRASPVPDRNEHPFSRQEWLEVRNAGLRQAEEQRRLAAVIFEESSEGMLITDADGRIQRVNRAFSVVTGYAEEDVRGQKPSLLASGRHDQAFYRSMWESLLGLGSWSGEIWNRRKNGEVYPEWLKITALRDGRGRLLHFVGIFSDVGEQKRAGREMEHYAFYDLLTDLPNRTLFTERLKHALIRASRDDSQVGLLYLDLDRFKTVNDSLGHPLGDQLLRQVADRLCQVVRHYDTVARLGGDEFGVVLSDLRDAAIASDITRRVAGQIREHLARPFLVGGQEVTIGASIGIALYPRDGDTCSELVKHADIAMYHAKHDRESGHAFFASEMNTRVARRANLENAVRHALERRELSLAYQPVVDIQAHRVVGVEALLRWNGPDGPVSPLEFIPVLEDLGLGQDMARWVLATACGQVGGWDFSGAESLWLSVNLSPRQLHHMPAGWVGLALAESGLPPQRLVVEVTEEHFRANPDALVAELNALRVQGIRVALDDFGTGHSSLGRLRHFPIDIVKIDRDFVSGLPDPKDLAIVNTVITMAHHLDLEFLSEGVETDAQLDLLRQLGCQLIQGYHFARPMPGPECARWCAEFNAGGHSTD